MKFSISIKISNNKKIAIDNFSIENNKINFLFGESGIGKTLISKTLLGLLDDNKFNIEINGEKYPKYLENLGVRDMLLKSFYVFQEPSGHLSYVQTLKEQLNEGKIKNSSEKQIILKNLFRNISENELNNLMEVVPNPFRPSGGEKQRILNAMAFMAMDTLSFSNAWNSLFVFDEPTGHLDVELRNILIDELIRMFIKDKPTVLFITHDYSVISYLKKKYSTLSDFLNYSEIFLSNGNLYQRDYEPYEYLKWISLLNELPEAQKNSRVILKIKKGIRVFDKILTFEENGKNVDLKLKTGEIVYLKAPSGFGKTTLAKILLGLTKTEFKAEIDKIEITENTKQNVFREKIWGKKLTMAFQHADEALNPKATIKDTFEALENIDFNELEQMFEKLFEEEYGNFKNNKIEDLSGGQKQKINLLRTILLNAKVTILDEPLNGMDLQSAKAVINLLEKLIQKKRTFLIISHNEDVFDKIINRKVCLKTKREKINQMD